MLRKRQDLSRLIRLRENRSERYSCSAQSKRVGKRGSGNTGVGYRQRVSRSSWTRRTGGRSRPIRQESGKSPPKKSTADDAATKPHMCPMRHALAVCLFFGLWGEFGRPYGSPGCTSSNPKLRRFLVVFLAASQARSWRSIYWAVRPEPAPNRSRYVDAARPAPAAAGS